MNVFISYTREKENYDDVVSHFRDRLENELRMRDRQSTVFQDTDMISAGACFSETIETALAQADALIVLVSPAWLNSDWCRREHETFSRNKQAAGHAPRILPLLWVDTNLNGLVEDPIATSLSKVQYRDWRNLRKKDWQSEAVKDEADEIAQALYKLVSE